MNRLFISFSFSPLRKLPIVFLALGMILSFSVWVRPQDDSSTAAQDAIELFNKGQDEHEKGNLEKAIELYSQALKLLPEFPEAELQKGNAYLSLGKNTDAEKSFRRTVELRGEWTLALTALGTLLEQKGEFAEAEKLLSRSIELDSGSFPAFSALAELRVRTNASPEVLKTLLEKIMSFGSKVNASASAFAT